MKFCLEFDFFEVEWSVKLQDFVFKVSGYVVPTFSNEGLVAAWLSKSKKYNGFVVRVLWLGLVVNWSK
jgi:hypothetical protein